MRLFLSLVFMLVASAAFAAPDMTASNLANALNTACGQCVAGVSLGVASDKSTWRIDFASGATAAQQQQAQAALQAFDPLAPAVPSHVTSAQGKIALLRAGLLGQVKSAIATDAELQLWYDNAATWERDNSHITTLGTQLGLSASQIDNLFITAAQIK